MTTFLLIDDALRSHELRHEIGEAIGDPVIFFEHEGRRILVGSILEESIFETREDVVDEFWTTESLGVAELIKDESFDPSLTLAELAARALERAGVKSACVPATFRLQEADYLRARGYEIEVDPEVWARRRRRKAPWELEGIERAQRAADTAMMTAARMLREAEPTNDGLLRFEGEILTADWIREAMSADLLSQGAESEEILVQSGDAVMRGHDLGTGPIYPNKTVVIDCFPRDRRTGCYTDMTRTYVPGKPSEEVERLHHHCCEALKIALDHLKPGKATAHQAVSDYLHKQGFPVRSHYEGSEPLRDGFYHALGHGVGLEVHERPRLGLRSDELHVGDVVAIEPGLYFAGMGGVRLEDTVFVAEEGPTHLTDPLPYDLTP